MRLYKYIILLIIGIGICSCSFLDEEIRSFSQKKSYYKTEEQILSGLNGCYLPLRTIYCNVNYFIITEGQSDIIYQPGNVKNGTLEGVGPTAPQMGTTLWTYGYQGVMRCNAIIAAIERADMTEHQKLPLRAEAVILRGFYYYILTSNFGDVPYYTEEVTDENNSRITHLKRMPASDTRNACIDEIYDHLITKRALPFARTYSTDNEDQYRIGAAVGLMLAGKMCLWEERWADAVEIFGYLEDIYGNGAGNPEGALDAYPLSDIPFYNKYVPESIFEISNTYTDYGLRVTGTLASRCTPPRAAQAVDEDDILGEDYGDLEDGTDYEEGDNTAYYNGIFIPWLGGNSRTTQSARPTTHFYKDLMPATSAYNDRRRAAYNPGDGAVIPDGGGYMAWGWHGWTTDEDRSTPSHWCFFAGTKNASGRPFLGNKFWCPGMQYNMDSNNYKIFRFAGALLGLAEAHLRRGNEDMACAYLNAIKSRAGTQSVSPADFPDKESLMEEIRNEYGRELFGEFQRKHDLVRWDIWYESIMNYSNNSALKKHARPCHRYYPIPDQEVIYSGGNLDNNEYNQYGL